VKSLARRLLRAGSKKNRLSGDEGKVRLDRSWAFFGLFLFWAGGFSGGSRGGFASLMLGLTAVSLGLLSVLFHEMGHRVAARLLGVSYEGRKLSFWGAFPEHRVDFGPPVPASITVRLAGPAASILLWQLSLSALGAGGGSWTAFFPQIAYFLHLFAVLNAFLAFINLFPGYPFDMGIAVAQIFCRANGLDRPGEGSLPERLGWVGAFAVSLFGLMLLGRGMPVSGFGSLILGSLLLTVLLDFRRRNRVARILEEEGLSRWMEPVPFLVRDEMWMQEVILRGFGEGRGERLPVVGREGEYRGEITWERARSRSFSQWEGVRVHDLDDLAPGPVVDWEDGASRILEILGRSPEGVPVLRNSRVSGFLRSAPLSLSGTVDGYLEGHSPSRRRPGEGAIPPEYSLPRKKEDNSAGGSLEGIPPSP